MGPARVQNEAAAEEDRFDRRRYGRAKTDEVNESQIKCESDEEGNEGDQFKGGAVFGSYGHGKITSIAFSVCGEGVVKGDEECDCRFRNV